MRLGSAFSRQNWPTTALAASLLLNAFLIGVLVTDSLRTHHRRGGDSPRAVAFELRQFAEKLPREDVDRIRAELSTKAPALGDRLERLRAIRAEINQLAAAPAPDRRAIDAKLAELRAEVTRMQEQAQKVTFDALLRLRPETRRLLAD